MPYLGLSSFLFSKVHNFTKHLKPFQCPTSGFLLFYKIPLNRMVVKAVVSMPYLGLSSFLHADKGYILFVPEPRFNALPRAFFFSTTTGEEVSEENTDVSMPYLGLSSFLRKNSIKF